MSDKKSPFAECTWGDGPDVMLVMSPDPDDLYDLTADQARKLASSLQMAAVRVDELTQVGEQHDATA